MKLSVFLLSLSVAASLASAEKARAWQTGKIVDAGRSQYLAGARTTPNYGTPGTSTSAQYQPVQTVVIEGADYAYVAQEDNSGPRWRLLPQRLANLTVNEPIKYAIEKHKLYLIDDNGKEHKLDIVKRVLLMPKP